VPPLIAIANNLCTNSSGLLSVPTGFTYNWSGGSTTNTQTVAIGNAGIYTVTITAATGCTNSNTVNVASIAPPAAPAITVSSLFCTGSSATITAASGYATYNWGGGNASPTQTISANGIYTVTVTSIAGCSTIGTINAVANLLPSPPTIAQSIPLCANKSTMLTANSGYIAYDWGLVVGQSLSVTTAGVYTVTATGSIGCTVTASATIVQAPPPALTLQGNTYFCTNGQTTLTTVNPFAAYAWSTNSSMRDISVSQAGIYDVTVTDTNGCTASASINITERSLPNANAGSNQAIYLGQSATLNASGGASYTWTPTTAFTNPTSQTQLVAPTETTRYFVLVTDTYGCEKTESVDVEVYDYLECLKVDEGISPNGDGKNDVWFIPCIVNFENTLQVYNRWGELLYSAVNYTQDWGGTSNGQQLPDGTYYYVIKIKTENPRKLYKGTITILR
jgi:gliding motility-associated-like protein